MTPRRLLHRLLALVRAPRLDRELDDEIAAHLELAERDGLAAGLSPAEARRRALRQFGRVDPMKEAHRDHRSARWLENLWKDVRYGMASLARDPGFTVVAVGVLALGIGANAAMFSLVDAVLLKPLPFPSPEQLVRVWEAPRPGVTNATSTPDFLDWKRMATSFEALAAEQSLSVALTGSGEPARVAGKAVTSDYFAVFATRAYMGRTFTPADDRPGADPVIVISNAAWHTYFGGAMDILTRRPVLDGVAHQVVGVLPPGPFDRDEAEFWKPLVFTPDQHLRGSHWLLVHGRLRAGVTLEAARAEMQAIDASLSGVYPPFKRDWTIVVEAFDRVLVGDDLRQSIVIAFGAVAVVLLIAAANVANLLLARGAARHKEMALRAALGAGRGRLVAQLLAETLVLCVIGLAAGIGLALVLVSAATPLLAASVPYTAEVGLDLRVLGFAAAVTLGLATLVGLLPAMQTSHGALARPLGGSARGSSAGHGRLRRAIVVGEVALSLVLLCAAALLFRSLLNLQKLETGVRIDDVVAMSLALPVSRYPTPGSAARFYDAVVERIEAAPGVSQAALTSHLPLRWIGNGESLEVAGLEERINIRFKRVDPSYFSALDIGLRAGRGIAAADRAGAPGVVVINEALAARLAELAGMTDPVGRPVILHCPKYVERGTTARDVQIVGVIRSERVSAPPRPDPFVVYVPLAQVPQPDVKLIVRATAPPSVVVPAVRAAVARVDPNLPVGDVVTMQEVRDRTLSGTSRPAWLIGMFAAAAALLAALGLYGVLAYAVSQRRREIGIRMALGAQARDVVAWVLRGALATVAIGLVLGLAGTVALTRVLKTMLFDVSPVDPLALAAASAVMTAIGLLAGFVPASRAAGVQPVRVLREDG